jgi:hypothetical protein
MCGLCGILGGGEHWTDRPGEGGNRRRERLEQVALLSRVLRAYGLTIEDWQGRSFLLGSRTGHTEIVDNLGALWPAAAKLLGRRLDPLDPAFLAALDPSGKG